MGLTSHLHARKDPSSLVLFLNSIEEEKKIEVGTDKLQERDEKVEFNVKPTSQGLWASNFLGVSVKDLYPDISFIYFVSLSTCF